MALIPCPDCAAEVSDLAVACPGCGRPNLSTSTAERAEDVPAGIPTRKTRGRDVAIAIAFGVGLVLFLVFCATPDHPKPSAPPWQQSRATQAPAVAPDQAFATARVLVARIFDEYDAGAHDASSLLAAAAKAVGVQSTLASEADRLSLGSAIGQAMRERAPEALFPGKQARAEGPASTVLVPSIGDRCSMDVQAIQLDPRTERALAEMGFVSFRCPGGAANGLDLVVPLGR